MLVAFNELPPKTLEEVRALRKREKKRKELPNALNTDTKPIGVRNDGKMARQIYSTKLSRQKAGTQPVFEGLVTYDRAMVYNKEDRYLNTTWMKSYYGGARWIVTRYRNYFDLYNLFATFLDDLLKPEYDTRDQNDNCVKPPRILVQIGDMDGRFPMLGRPQTYNRPGTYSWEPEDMRQPIEVKVIEIKTIRTIGCHERKVELRRGGTMITITMFSRTWRHWSCGSFDDFIDHFGERTLSFVDLFLKANGNLRGDQLAPPIVVLSRDMQDQDDWAGFHIAAASIYIRFRYFQSVGTYRIPSGLIAEGTRLINDVSKELDNMREQKPNTLPNEKCIRFLFKWDKGIKERSKKPC